MDFYSFLKVSFIEFKNKYTNCPVCNNKLTEIISKKADFSYYFCDNDKNHKKYYFSYYLEKDIVKIDLKSELVFIQCFVYIFNKIRFCFYFFDNTTKNIKDFNCETNNFYALDFFINNINLPNKLSDKINKIIMLK